MAFQMMNSHATNRTMLWLTVIILLTAIGIAAASPETQRIGIKFAKLVYLLKHGAA
jgi:hypothetical protein